MNGKPMGALLLSAFLAATLLPGCPARRLGRPAWLVSRRHECCPPSRYLFAVGSGPTLEAARQAARKQLRQRLANLRSEAEKTLRQACGKSLALPGPTALKGLLAKWQARPKQVLQWRRSDGSLWAVALAVDRRRWLAKVGQRVATFDAAVQKSLAEAEHRFTAEDVAGALAATLRAIAGGIQLAAAQHLSLAAGAGANGKATAGCPLVAAEHHLEQVLANLEMRPIRGQHQWLEPSGRVAEPLVCGLYGRGAGGRLLPVAGLPVRFSAPAPAPGWHCLTSDLGLCSVRIPELPASGGPVNLAVALDTKVLLERAGLVGNLAPGAGLKRLIGRPRAEFKLLPAAGRTRLALLVQGRGDIGRQLSHFGAELEQEFERRGLLRADTSAVAADLAMAETVEEYAEILSGRADLLLAGTIAVELENRLHSNFVVCAARAQLQLVAVARPETKVRIALDHQAPGLDRRAACRRAWTRLRHELTGRIHEAGSALLKQGKP